MVLVVSGGNIDIPLLERVVPRALLARRRLLILRVALSDRPGSLGRLTGLIGEQGANILHLFHDRLARELPLDYTRVEINLEIRGPEHGEAVLTASGGVSGGGKVLKDGFLWNRGIYDPAVAWSSRPGWLAVSHG